MKRFKLQSGHVIKVDDADAYLMRSYVWNGTTVGRNGWVSVRRGASSGFGERGLSVYLSHELMHPESDQYVAHINGDSLDFRRCNLQVRPRSELARTASKVNRLVQLVMHA